MEADRPGAGQDAQPDTRRDARPYVGPGASPDARPDTRRDARPYVGPGAGPDARPDTRRDARPYVGPGASPDARPDTRRDAGLDEADLAADPFAQFSAWFLEVARAGVVEPEAMVLATAAADGAPSSRTVLLKGVDGRGFVFYTNYESRKGRELAENPRASLVLPWHTVRRQVIAVGDVERLPREESERYFHSRERGSQLGAWASRQSAVIPSREVLERRYAEYDRRWPGGEEIPLPAFWGGFRVVPVTVEFWRGRRNRLHDRLRYRREAGGWTVERLSP